MRTIYCLLLVFLLSCNEKKYNNPHILIDTNYGVIEAELYPKNAPVTVANFLKNIDAQIYKKTSFYRVLKNEDLPATQNYGLIQAGLWPDTNKYECIAHEPTNVTKLTHETGTLSMARAAAGTATTEFFICIGNQQTFDAGMGNNKTDTVGYAAFGTVVEGMAIVRAIQATKSNGENFVEKITIKNITRL